MAGQNVEQLPAFGWHDASEMNFFSDCAIRPGESLQEALLVPAENEDEGEDGDDEEAELVRVIWTPQGGYILWRHAEDNQAWRQSQTDATADNPAMHPEIPGVRIAGADADIPPPLRPGTGPTRTVAGADIESNSPRSRITKPSGGCSMK